MTSGESPGNSVEQQVQETLSEAIRSSSRWQYWFWCLSIIWLLAASASIYFFSNSVAQFNRSEASIQSLRSTAGELNASIENRVSRLDQDLKGRSDEVTQQLAKTHEEVATFRSELKKDYSQVATLASGLAEVRTMVHKLSDGRSDFDKARVAIAELNKTVAAHQVQLDQLAGLSLAAFKRDLEKTRADVDSVNKTVAALRVDVNRLAEQRPSSGPSQKDLTELKGDVRGVQAHIEKLDIQTSQKLEALTTEINKLRTEITNLDKRLTKLERRSPR